MTDSSAAARSSNVAAKLLGIRWLVRTPIALYRIRLGFLLGNRFLLLEHRGRVSGRPRRVVLEVIGRPARDSYLVVSGYGARAQWYRNLRANPRVRIAVGVHGLRSAQAHLLGPDDGAAALESYARAHPKAWSSLGPVLETTLGAPAKTVPVIRFDVLSK